MARHIYQRTFTDGNGKAVLGGTVSIYLAGTTTSANVYTASSGGSPVASVTSSSSDGSFSFYIDELEYVNQKFKIVLSKTNFEPKTYDDIEIIPFNSYLSVSSYASLTAAVTAIGSTEIDLVIDKNTTLTANTTIPDNIYLKTRKGAVINRGSYTLNINCDFEKKNSQFIDGTGTLTFSGIARPIDPRWLGAKASNDTSDSTTNTTALKYLIGASGINGAGGEIDLGEGTYYVDGGTLIATTAGTKLKGVKGKTWLKLANSGSGNIIALNDNNLVLDGVGIDGNKSNAPLGGHGVYLSSCTNLDIKNCYIKDTIAQGIAYSSITNLTIENTIIENHEDHGIGIDSGATAGLTGFTISDCRITTDNVTPANTKAIYLVGSGANLTTKGRVTHNYIDGGNQQRDGVFMGNCDDIEVSTNYIRNCVDDGITIDAGCSNLTIINNTSNDSNSTCGIFAIDDTALSEGITITGNTCNNNAQSGIKIGGNTQNWTLTANTCMYNTEHGIQILALASGTGRRGTIVGNICSHNEQNGMRINDTSSLTITGNQCRNNGSSGSGKIGISVYNTSDITLVGNICEDDQGSPTQEYGININGGTLDNFILIGNECQNNTISDFFIDNGLTNLKISNNSGYVSETSGDDTIASGTTSKTITHGLGRSPLARNVNITLKENPTNDPGNIWVSGVSSTQFIVNCRNDPGASNLDFGWNASLINVA